MFLLPAQEQDEDQLSEEIQKVGFCSFIDVDLTPLCSFYVPNPRVIYNNAIKNFYRLNPWKPEVRGALKQMGQAILKSVVQCYSCQQMDRYARMLGRASKNKSSDDGKFYYVSC